MFCAILTFLKRTKCDFRIKIDDPRYISGELVGINKGRHWKQKGPNKSGMYIRKHK